MGASLSAPGRKGGRRRRGVPRYGAMAEINMTPFIDVMLVLLIIFMVAAPLLATGVAVDLPQTRAGALNIDQKPVSIAIDEKGQVYLMDQPVETTQLLDKLKEAAKQGFDERIYVRGSKAVNYGRVAEVMSLVISAGYKKVALVTEQEKK
ncbi:biopolymer transporter ExbD [Methylocystis sp.]|jgi:biopolymer transport protein TolR|uniref:ExbD/TolR family protein n=1 Tax=Methylocystis sp. TaxID=1911079 RepID=UPI0025E82BDA|nr:biopolymer transporter ExbD [Methylocystis sp.]